MRSRHYFSHEWRTSLAWKLKHWSKTLVHCTSYRDPINFDSYTRDLRGSVTLFGKTTCVSRHVDTEVLAAYQYISGNQRVYFYLFLSCNASDVAASSRQRYIWEMSLAGVASVTLTLIGVCVCVGGWLAGDCCKINFDWIINRRYGNGDSWRSGKAKKLTLSLPKNVGCCCTSFSADPSLAEGKRTRNIFFFFGRFRFPS